MKPEKIQKFKTFFEYTISNLYPGTEVKIEAIGLTFNDTSPEITANKIAFIDIESKNTIIKLNKASIKLHLLKLIFGNMNFSKINIDDVTVNTEFIKYNEYNNRNLNKSDEKFINKISNIKWNKIPFSSIYIRNINIIKKDENLKIESLEFDLNNDAKARYVSLFAKGFFEKSLNSIDIDTEMKIDNDVISASGKFHNLPSYVLTKYLKNKDEYDELDLTINGNWKIEINNEELEKFEIDIENLNGYYYGKELKSELMKLSISENSLTINKLNLEFDRAEIFVEGSIRLKDNFTNFDNINLDFKIKNLETNNIKYLWKNNIEESARIWVIENINNGIINNAQGRLKFSQNDIEQKILPEESIKVLIDFENLDVKYYDKFPKLLKTSGIANFSEKLLNINLLRGDILDSKVKSANIRIGFDSSPISILGKITGEIKDIVKFIPNEDVESAKGKDIDLTNISGSAETDIDISIPVSDQTKMKFLVNSKLRKLTLNKLFKIHTLDKGELIANFNGEKVIVKGTANIDNNPAKIDWLNYVDRGNQYDSKTILSVDLIPGNTEKLLPQYIKFEKGIINTKTTITSKNRNNKIDFTADLTGAEFKIPDIGYVKSNNKSLISNISAMIQDDKNLKIDLIDVHGNDFLIKGNADLDIKSMIINYVNLDKVKFDHNNFKLNYSLFDNKANIKIDGKEIDLSKLDFKNFSESKENSNNFFLNASIDHVRLKNKFNLNEMKIFLEHNDKGVGKLEIGATDDEDNQIFSKFEETTFSNMDFVIRADNLSKILNGLDFSNKIKAGNLNIKGTKVISETGNIHYKGKVKLKNFILTEASVFAKLFTITSLPKIIELPFAFLPGESISRNDIPFTNLTSKFDYSNNVIHLSDATIEGPQIGLTIDGNVDFAKKDLNLGGTVIPELLGVSKIINNIPIIGTMLQGGKKKGLLAASYTIKGKFDNPSIFVNPLSILTPGFFRNIFNIFETNRKMSED